MSFDKTLLLFFRKFVQGFHGHRSLSKTKILINYVTRLEEGSTEIAPAVSRIRAVAMTRVIFPVSQNPSVADSSRRQTTSFARLSEAPQLRIRKG
jgi:hypothetical protein